MSTPIRILETDFSFHAGPSGKAKNHQDVPQTFRILVMGDFSGKGSTIDSTKHTDPIPVRVDRDTLDTVMSQMSVSITLPLNGPRKDPVRIRFSCLDDFHPDTLFQKLETFKAVETVRDQLMTPSPRTTSARPRKSKKPEPQPPIPPPPSGSGLLSQVLDKTKSTHDIPSKPLTEFLDRIVSPHLVPDNDPEQETVLQLLDDSAASLMRAILHHPDFKALEAAWRGLAFLVQRLETNESMSVWILDFSRKDLAKDLIRTSMTEFGILNRIIADLPQGEPPWSVIAGNYSFARSREDINILRRILSLAARANAPFISAAGDTILCRDSLSNTPDPDDWYPSSSSDDQQWTLLRLTKEMDHLGLALPRFLLRLPYGTKTDPIDTIDFEEIHEDFSHNDYLWGNPCFALALLLGQGFIKNGPDFEPSDTLSISDLPLFTSNGEALPCAEVMMGHQAAALILAQGLMPLLSFQNQDHIRLARFQSLAMPPTRLAGPWEAG